MHSRWSVFALALTLGTTGVAYADQAPDTQTKIQSLQQQLDAMKAQLDELKAQQEKDQAAQAKAKAVQAAAPATRANGSPLTFLLGKSDEMTLYGNLDLSLDDTTKGLKSSYTLPDGAVVKPVGNTGYLSAISTNLSYIGLRGRHVINPRTSVVYQLETQIDVSSTSGATNSNYNNDGVVKGGLTSRNSYVGIANKYVGALKIGKTDAPYKTSTAKMNPFSGELGDYAVIMGNSGGDNRVEFGTRLDHSIWYESPVIAGFTFNALASPGQNRSGDNSIIATGEYGCSGGDLPGSGASPPACNDGSWGSVYSANLAYQRGGLYITGAYEIHKKVNRQVDVSPPLSPTDPLTLADVADEDARKVGIQYAFPTGTVVNAIYEDMKRYVPASLAFQNERQRNGMWYALTQNLTRNDSINFGFAHAGATPGYPGLANGVGGANPDNSANMYTIAYKHNVDRNFSWYADWALTANRPYAHYDLGAGGRGVTTDCHDGSQQLAFDPTSPTLTSGIGPQCFGGGQIQGFSLGMDFKF
jgi:predicted porin